MTKKNMKKQRKQQTKPKKQPKRRQQVAVKPVFESPCGAQYFAACRDPFDPRARNSCVPRAPARMSAKYTVKTRGVFGIGVNGAGFLAVTPCLSNDYPSGWISSTGYSLTAINTADANVGAFYAAGLPYAQVNFIPPAAVGNYAKPNAMGRIISCGIRIRYIGTELNKGGSIYRYVDPNHGNLNGLQITSIQGYPETASIPVGRGWVSLSVSAIEDEEQSYPDLGPYMQSGTITAVGSVKAIYPFSGENPITSGNTQGGAPGIFIVTGVAGNQYEWEYIVHAEYVGGIVTGNLSKSHASVDDANLVSSTVTSAYSKSSETPSWSESMTQTLRETVVENRQFLETMAGMAGSYYGRKTGQRQRLRAIREL